MANRRALSEITMSDHQQSIGQRIAAARRAAGLTQAALAARCGVQPMTVSRWETGTVDPPSSQLERVAAATGRRVELVAQNR